MISENTANIRGGHYLKDRFIDQVRPNRPKLESDEQSGKKIADSIIGGLTGKGGNKS